MALVTSKDYQLTPDISPLTQVLTQAIFQKAKQDELFQQKTQAEKLKDDIANTSAQLLRVRDIKDYSTQRSELAKLGQENIKQGKDASIYTEALNITNPDEMNLYLTRNALKGDTAKKFIEEKVKTSVSLIASPALQKAIESGAISPSEINKNNIAMYEQLANAGVLTGSGKVVSPELIQSVKEGSIDPSKINSRTLSVWNAFAKSRVNATGAKADIAAKTEAIKDAVKYAALSKRTISVIDKNMPLLVDLAEKVNVSGVPVADRGYTNIRAGTTNNPDVIKYVNTIKTLRAEYANMLAKGTQVTESMRQEATEAIPSGLSAEGYRALQTQLEIEGRNIIDAANETAQSIQFGKVGQPPIANIERPEPQPEQPAVPQSESYEERKKRLLGL